MAREFEQIAKTAHYRAFVNWRESGETSRIGLFADVLGNLGNTIDAACIVRVAGAVEQRQFNPGNPCIARRGFHSVQIFGSVGRGKRALGLEQELQAMASDVHIAQLPGGYDLEHHRGLMRRAMPGCSPKQRHPIIQPLILHQGVDPLRGLWCAGAAIFRP